MALKYNVEYKHSIQIGEKLIKFKPWNTKNEKDYLIAVEAEERVTESQIFDILIKPCLEDPEVVLSPNEQTILMIEIRKKSLGSTFAMKYTCSSCKQLNDINVSFDNIIRYKDSKWEDVKCENILFVFADIPSKNLKERISSAPNRIERNFIEFLAHIKEIEIDGKVENTFSFDELKDFVESLPTHIFDEVYEKFNDMKSSLNLHCTSYCMFCNHENEIDLESIPNFLWM